MMKLTEIYPSDPKCNNNNQNKKKQQHRDWVENINIKKKFEIEDQISIIAARYLRLVCVYNVFIHISVYI